MNPFLKIHILFSSLSYLAFILTFFSGGVFLWMENRLKHKHLPGLGRFSWSLEAIDRFNARTLTVGFILLTMGITSGVLATHQRFGKLFVGDPSEVWTITSWLIYAGIVLVRGTCTLRGRKVMLLATLAFGMFVFTLIGVSSFFKGIHQLF